MNKKDKVVATFRSLNLMHHPYPEQGTIEFDFLMENCPCYQCDEMRPLVAQLCKLYEDLIALYKEDSVPA
jgi:hypothetical protein